MILSLPYPPSVNHYYGHAKTGSVYIKAEGKEYRQAVICAVLEQQKRLFPVTEPIALIVHLYPPDKRERDLDNVLKALFDSLTGDARQNRSPVLFVTDSNRQLKDTRIIWHNPVKGGKVEVELAIMAATENRLEVECRP